MDMPDIDTAFKVISGVLMACAALIALGGILLIVFRITPKAQKGSRRRIVGLFLTALSLFFGFFVIYNSIFWLLDPAGEPFFFASLICVFIQNILLVFPIANMTRML